jgi:hypothetical protein
VAALVLALVQSAALHAQKQQSLPQGKPFQQLEQSLIDSQQKLLQQIESLQSQVDANNANDVAQGELIGALQTLTSQLELSLLTTQASLKQLADYTALENQLLKQQLAEVSELQAQVASSSSLAELYELYNAQQAVLTTLTNQLTVLASQGTTQQSQLDSLNAQLQTLKTEYQATSDQLQAGCPAGSSIRQLSPTTVVCEPNGSGGGSLSGSEFLSVQTTVLPLAQATIDAYCGPSPLTSPYVPTGGGVSSTAGLTLVQSVRLSNTGWRVVVRNPQTAGNLVVQSRVTCVRLN